jgi:hypothetical protein
MLDLVSMENKDATTVKNSNLNLKDITNERSDLENK